MPTPPLDPQAPPSRRLAPLGLLALVLAAHAVQAVRLFPTRRALLDDDRPVLVVDHAIHLYHGALGSRFLLEHGTTWGYDPFFMAGYPETPVWDSSSNLAILFQAAAGGGYHPRAYNLGLLLCAFVALAAVPAGAAAAGLGAWEVALATLLAWPYFWCGWPDTLWRSGLFSFVTASGLIVLLAGLALRFERRPGVAGWAAVAAAGAATLFAHVTAPIMALGGVLGLTASAARRQSLHRLGALGLAALAAAVANLFWLVPLWRFRKIRVGEGFFMTSSSARYIVDFYLARALDSRLSLLILIAGLAGLLAWWAAGERTRAASFGGGALLLLGLIAFGGSWSATRVLEPLRFKAPVHLLLAVPAGSALARATARLGRAAGGGRRGTVLGLLAWLAALGAVGLTMPRLAVEGFHRMRVDRPLVAGLRPQMRQLVAWLRENTDDSARILFEDQLRLLEFTDPECTHWTPLLPVLLGPDRRQFIGGIYHSAFIAHHQLASFGDFHLGPRPIDAWGADELRDYFGRYNVGWVVCWSPLSRFVFDRSGLAARVATLPRYSSPGLPISGNPHEWSALTRLGGREAALRYMAEGERSYAVYRIDRPRTFFLRGRGRIASVDANRLELADVVPEGGEAVVSLHWLDTWRTEPPRPVGPWPTPGDPVPFVRIALPGPVDRIVLVNGYGSGGPPPTRAAAGSSPPRAATRP